ncbi:hypothetical protein DPMN_063234 [Dreissena polymorpha]|uniref:Uncharacterized protein n=1 Tax=Dreissena polymorpha TaxID=45954 RepID=A0A9D4CAW0_DREPO|nr:hypothetical protein DPMN_063234 [Dreissena polymorpha]
MLTPRIMKLHRYIDHDWQMTPIDFQVTSTSLHGWETLKAFLKFPVPRPGIEPGTSGMVDQSVYPRLPHHQLRTADIIHHQRNLILGKLGLMKINL